MTLPASDNFNRTSTSPLGGNWTTATGCSAIKGINDTSVCSTSLQGGAYWNADTFPANQYAQIKVLSLVDYAGVILRHGTDYYTTQVRDSARTRISRYNGGAFTLLQTINTTVAVNDILKWAIVGSDILTFVNGTGVGSPLSDSTVSAAGPAGISAYRISGDVSVLDDFQADIIRDGVSAHFFESQFFGGEFFNASLNTFKPFWAKNCNQIIGA